MELSTYTVQYMLGEIKKFFRDDGIIRVGRNTKDLSMKIVESINEKIDKIDIDSDEHNKLIDKITIMELIETLSIRDKKIINLRYFKEKTQIQVAETLGISQVQVSRLERKILEELKIKLIS